MQKDERNLTLLTDLYELTMIAGYFEQGKVKQMANFDWFYRNNPDNGGFCIVAGLEQLIDYILNLKFSKEKIDYLRSLKIFSEDFLNYLKNFRFTGDIYAILEGAVVFPNEPLIRVTAPLPEAQFIESALLNIMNHQTLIATKAARLCMVTQGDSVIDFGLRRAHGPDAAIYGARAAFIGGCVGTSNVEAGKRFGIPVKGTQAHSWIESFSSELEAFRAYARTFPDSCLLLVDTYDTLGSGVPNAIKVALELEKKGHKFLGIRLDSGDLASLSKKARQMLDKAGLKDAKIVASNDLDEYTIESLKRQGAKIDIWGVGTKLMTSYSQPALGGVYKLTAIDEDGEKMVPKIKISSNVEKITNPGKKELYRVYNRDHNILGDIIFLDGENIPERESNITVYHSMYKHKKTRYSFRFGIEPLPLLHPVFLKGKLVYQKPSLIEIQKKTRRNLEMLDEGYKRFLNPHIYKVSLSEKLFNLKQKLISTH